MSRARPTPAQNRPRARLVPTTPSPPAREEACGRTVGMGAAEMVGATEMVDASFRVAWA